MGAEFLQHLAHVWAGYAELPNCLWQWHREVYRRCGISWPGCAAQVCNRSAFESVARLCSVDQLSALLDQIRAIEWDLWVVASAEHRVFAGEHISQEQLFIRKRHLES